MAGLQALCTRESSKELASRALGKPNWDSPDKCFGGRVPVVAGRRALSIRLEALSRGGRPSGGLMQINGRNQSLADPQWMERIDWVFALSLASLALGIGAICILLFAM
jgi:hypothetical protein